MCMYLQLGLLLEFLPQLRDRMEKCGSKINLKHIIIHNSNLKLGITIMAFGFVKKEYERSYDKSSWHKLTG